MNPSIEYQNGQTFIGGLNHVYHCNHYNANLQMAVLLSDGLEENFDPRHLLQESIAILVHELKQKGYTRDDLEREFTHCGFGILQQITPTQFTTPSSHYGQASYLLGQPEKGCFFDAGFIEGITGLSVIEDTCRHTGATIDSFILGSKITTPLQLTMPPPFTPVPERFQFKDCTITNTKVDESKIISAVASLPLYGRTQAEGGDGLIPAFGVVLTNHYADYYNMVSYKTYHRMIHAGLPFDMAADAFQQCGHICAFNTFGGIAESPEFFGLVVPMCKTIEDWIHGLVAVINALGWGVWRVERIVPGQELIIRIYNSYEGIGYRRLYPKSNERTLSFLAMGAVRGLAHLFWKIDIRERPTLTGEFYAEVFNQSNGHFHAEQTHAIAAGDEYDRIVAWR